VKRAPQRLLLAHGAGGRLTHQLVSETFVPAFDNPYLAPLSDSAVLPELPAGRVALTTDAFVVDPPVFPASDLGHLSVCGTVNDLAMAGARPLWLTWALILEEGADGALIDTCVSGAAAAARLAGVTIVAGDTKVVPRGRGDRIYAVSAGVGVVPPRREVGDHRIEVGDVILASGTLGDHGATIMACRHGLEGQQLVSDCAPVNHLVESLFDAGIEVHSLHDPTRGGVIAVCNEVAARAGVRLVLDELAVPTHPASRAVCELLGLELLSLACEGRFLAWVAAKDGEPALAALRAQRAGADAAIIGRVDTLVANQVPVILRTRVGSERPLDLLAGTDLPRIC
jgi:hydrogenase expression/formation protein HypE